MYLKKLLQRYKETDIFFLQLTFTLAVIGLIFAFSSSTYTSYKLTNQFWQIGFKQFIAFIIGLSLFALFWKFDYKKWYKLTLFVGTLALVLMFFTSISGIGKEIGGAKRWIDIGIFQFQPAELAKFAVLLLFAKQFAKFKWNDKRGYLYLCFSLVLIFFIFKQPDLGSSMILVLLYLLLMLLFEWPIWLLFIITLITSFGCIHKIMNTPYQTERLKYWLNPYLEPLGKGYNLIQAKYALGLGGLIGSGVGNSLQKQGSLPVPQSDFIIAIIGEEIGFIGLTAVLILYFTWILRGLYLVNKTKERYGKILGTAIILLISVQAVINILVAVGLMPITGVTLPFFSCGGTSLIVTFTMCGILFNITEKSRF